MTGQHPPCPAFNIHGLGCQRRPRAPSRSCRAGSCQVANGRDISNCYRLGGIIAVCTRGRGSVCIAQDPRKLCWDLFVGGMIVYSVALIPWRIAFKQDAQGVLWWFERIVDTIFAVDILLCFNSTYFEGV